MDTGMASCEMSGAALRGAERNGMGGDLDNSADVPVCRPEAGEVCVVDAYGIVRTRNINEYLLKSAMDQSTYDKVGIIRKQRRVPFFGILHKL